MANISNGLTWYHKPQLRDPVFIAVFEGWNDAGEAASDSADWLVDTYSSQLIGEIDGEEYFDYQSIRPHISLGDGEIRQTIWPRNRIYGVTLEEAERDLVIFVGHEPNYRWKTFCDAIVDIILETKCEYIYTLGSLMAEVPHTRPAKLTAMCTSKDRLEALEVIPSSYDGPTGIVGVLQEYFVQQNLEATSLWSTIPHYVAQRPQPGAVAALLNTLGALIGIDFDTSELATQTLDWIEHVDEAVAEDEQALDYVQDLEDIYDSGDLDGEDELSDQEFPTADDLANEVEKYLRDQPPEQ